MNRDEYLFNEPYCSIWYDKESLLLYAKWTGDLTLEQVKEGCSLMTSFIEENRIKIHFSNHVNLKKISNDIQLYLTQSWFPEVEEAGLRKVAALTSWDAMTEITIEKVNKTANVGELLIQSFKNELDCYKWLGE